MFHGQIVGSLRHGLHQPHAVFPHVRVQVERELPPRGGLQIHQHYAGLRGLEAGPANVFQNVYLSSLPWQGKVWKLWRVGNSILSLNFIFKILCSRIDI